ncbi:hypothetical protein HK099_005426 [Clydaea vesicula]|uniref:Uncharacterized protein n=1 Tax=Clydaea vesicula TaxID=447962 RepID=A0AAD5TZ80_9FUNG|nr:hypothetical protein HK099_005426 [Clydaea vesicula]
MYKIEAKNILVFKPFGIENQNEIPTQKVKRKNSNSYLNDIEYVNNFSFPITEGTLKNITLESESVPTKLTLHTAVWGYSDVVNKRNKKMHANVIFGRNFIIRIDESNFKLQSFQYSISERQNNDISQFQHSIHYLHNYLEFDDTIYSSARWELLKSLFVLSNIKTEILDNLKYDPILLDYLSCKKKLLAETFLPLLEVLQHTVDISTSNDENKIALNYENNSLWKIGEDLDRIHQKLMRECLDYFESIRGSEIFLNITGYKNEEGTVEEKYRHIIYYMLPLLKPKKRKEFTPADFSNENLKLTNQEEFFDFIDKDFKEGAKENISLL